MQNLNTKSIVDIDALTTGMSVTMMRVGSIIPIAALSYAQQQASPMLPYPEYTRPLVDGFFDVWKIATASYK